MRASYVIAGYNDMAKIRYPGGEALLIGLEAFVPPSAQIAAGHNVVNVGYGRLEAGGWYLVRQTAGRYDLRQVAAASGRPLVATRLIRVSPFPPDGNALYFAGYDANKVPGHGVDLPRDICGGPRGGALGVGGRPLADLRVAARRYGGS
jgi:hypothetical protein